MVSVSDVNFVLTCYRFFSNRDLIKITSIAVLIDIYGTFLVVKAFPLSKQFIFVCINTIHSLSDQLHEQPHSKAKETFANNVSMSLVSHDWLQFNIHDHLHHCYKFIQDAFMFNICICWLSIWYPRIYPVFFSTLCCTYS